MKSAKKIIPYALLAILIMIGSIMAIERMTMAPEILFEGDYNFISKNGGLFSYDGDTTFLYVTYSNIQFGHYINILCMIGMIFSWIDLLLNKNRYSIAMFVVYLIISIYSMLPTMILIIFNKATPLISYEAAFLTFQFNFNELFIITLSYISIVFLSGYYLYKQIKGETSWS